MFCSYTCYVTIPADQADSCCDEALKCLAYDCREGQAEARASLELREAAMLEMSGFS